MYPFKCIAPKAEQSWENVMINRRAALILLVGDLLALALFIFVGELQHELLNAYNPFARVLVQTLALAIAWLPLAWWLGIYSAGDVVDGKRAGKFLLRSLAVWLYAAPLGLILRAWIYGAATVLILFANAALVFGGLFVIGWRAVFVLLWLRYKRRRSAIQ